MSRMSQLSMELEESAVNLGFESLEEAERAGYRPDYNTGELYLHEPSTPNRVDELEQAHEAWLEERRNVLEELGEAYEEVLLDRKDQVRSKIERAMKFIDRGEV